MARKFSKEQTAFLENFDSAVNLFMSNEEYRQLAEAACNTHRTLQQNKMRFVLEMIKVWAEMYRDGWYDLRSEATCQLASKIVEAFEDDFHMPVV